MIQAYKKKKQIPPKSKYFKDAQAQNAGNCSVVLTIEIEETCGNSSEVK